MYFLSVLIFFFIFILADITIVIKKTKKTIWLTLNFWMGVYSTNPLRCMSTLWFYSWFCMLPTYSMRWVLDKKKKNTSWTDFFFNSLRFEWHVNLIWVIFYSLTKDCFYFHLPVDEWSVVLMFILFIPKVADLCCYPVCNSGQSYSNWLVSFNYSLFLIWMVSMKNIPTKGSLL